MRAIAIFFCFLFSALLVTITIHDAYWGWQDYKQGMFPPFRFTDIGWFWTEYAGQSHEWVRDNIERAYWDSMIAPVMRLTAFFVALGLCAVIYGTVAFVHFGNKVEKAQDSKRITKELKKGGPTSAGKRQKKAKSGDFSFRVDEIRGKKKVMNYKRKK